MLLAAMLLAPVGRIGIAQAMAAPAGAPAIMAGHCAGMPGAASAQQKGHHQQAPQKDDERMAVDCMIACAAMATGPAPFVAPPRAPAALAGATLPSNLTGIRPGADPPPPRSS
jgi:hypothetical protein